VIMKKSLTIIAIASLIGACAILPRANQPDSETVSATGAIMNHRKSFFVARKGIDDGYVVIFHVMPAPEGMGYSRKYYHLMVSIVKDGMPLTGLQVYSDVKHPDGSSQKEEKMMRMGDWYLTRYNLSHDLGRHWLTIHFEASGKKYTSGIYYPEIDYSE